MKMQGTKLLLLGLVLATALAACGRKGDLELPPGAAPQEAQPSSGPVLEQVLGDEPTIDSRPLDNELEDISPRRRVDQY
ncbi:MAG: lipoprotein [Parvibaculum sp.]